RSRPYSKVKPRRKAGESAEKGSAARRRPKLAREAYFLYVDCADEGANEAAEPLSALSPPLADLCCVLAIVWRAGAFEHFSGRRGGGEVLIGQRVGGGHEVVVRGLQLRKDVRQLGVAFGLDEPSVPRIEIVVRDALRVRRLVPAQPSKRRNQLAMPTGD